MPRARPACRFDSDEASLDLPKGCGQFALVAVTTATLDGVATPWITGGGGLPEGGDVPPEPPVLPASPEPPAEPPPPPPHAVSIVTSVASAAARHALRREFVIRQDLPVCEIRRPDVNSFALARAGRGRVNRERGSGRVLSFCRAFGHERAEVSRRSHNGGIGLSERRRALSAFQATRGFTSNGSV